MPIVECDYCGKEIKKSPYRIKKNKKNFCNAKCQKLGIIKKNKIVIKGDYSEIIINSPKFGEIRTIVDTKDIELISEYCWGANFNKCINGFYIRTNLGNKGTLKLHRLVANCPQNLQVDHINHNTLDNRKSNLKVCTALENMRNRTVSKVY